MILTVNTPTVVRALILHSDDFDKKFNVHPLHQPLFTPYLLSILKNIDIRQEPAYLRFKKLSELRFL